MTAHGRLWLTEARKRKSGAKRFNSINGRRKHGRLTLLYWYYRNQSAPPACADAIDRDIGRTCPRHILFRSKEGNGQRGLRRVLIAWVCLERALVPESERCGYVQGMNMIVAHLLKHVDENVAFEIFTRMMVCKKYLLLHNFAVGMTGALQKMKLVSVFCEKHCPILHSYFEKYSIEPVTYATEWVLTLYSYVLEGKLLCLVWDSFFMHGWDFFFKFTITLLKHFEDHLVGFLEKVQQQGIDENVDIMNEIYLGLKSIGDRSRQQTSVILGKQTKCFLESMDPEDWVLESRNRRIDFKK